MVQGCTKVCGLRDHIVDPCCVWVWELFTVSDYHIPMVKAVGHRPWFHTCLTEPHETPNVTRLGKLTTTEEP